MNILYVLFLSPKKELNFFGLVHKAYSNSPKGDSCQNTLFHILWRDLNKITLNKLFSHYSNNLQTETVLVFVSISFFIVSCCCLVVEIPV